jgi:GTP 3',8-cyclase
VKLTGGDPALYGPLIDVVAKLKTEVGFNHIEVISRHPKIANIAPQLKAAGLDQINFSLDTTSEKQYRLITGKRDFHELVSAIRTFAELQLPVKLNTVMMKGINDDEYDKIVNFSQELGISTLKFLDVIVDLDQGFQSFQRRLEKIVPGAKLEDLYYDMGQIRTWLADRASSKRTIKQGSLGHPMDAFLLPGGLEVVLKDSNAGAWYSEVCSGCIHYPCHDALMALRLGPDYDLQLCLLNSEINIKLRDQLQDPQELEQSIRGALAAYTSAKFHGGIQL